MFPSLPPLKISPDVNQKVTDPSIFRIGEACTQTVFSCFSTKDRASVMMTCTMWRKYLLNLVMQENINLSNYLNHLTKNLSGTFEKEKQQILNLPTIYNMHLARSLEEKEQEIYKLALDILKLTSSNQPFFHWDPPFQLLFTKDHPLLKNPDIAILVVQQYEKAFSLIAEETPRYTEIALKAIEKYPSNIKHVKKDHPDYIMLACKAIENDLDLLSYLPMDHPKFIIYAMKWARIPFMHPIVGLTDHPDFAIIFEEATKFKPVVVIHQLISEYQGRHLDYNRLVLVAFKNNPLFLQCIPKDFPGYVELALEACKREGRCIEYIRQDDPNYAKLAAEAVKNNPIAILLVPEDTVGYADLFLEAYRRSPSVMDNHFGIFPTVLIQKIPLLKVFVAAKVSAVVPLPLPMRPASLSNRLSNHSIVKIGEACTQTVFSYLSTKDRVSAMITCTMWRKCLLNLVRQENVNLSNNLNYLIKNLSVEFEKEKQQILDLPNMWNMHMARSLQEKQKGIYRLALHILQLNSVPKPGSPWEESTSLLLFTKEHPLLKNPDIAIVVVQEYERAFRLIAEETPRYTEIALKAIEKYPSNIRYVKKEHPDYIMLACKAIEKDLSLLSYLPSSHPKFMMFVMKWARSPHNQNIVGLTDHPDFVIIFEEATKFKHENMVHSLIYQTEGKHRNYNDLILIGFKNNPLFIKWIPKDYPGYAELALEACKRNGICIQYIETEHPNYAKLAEEAVKNNPRAIFFIPENTPGYITFFLEAYKRSPKIIGNQLFLRALGKILVEGLPVA